MQTDMDTEKVLSALRTADWSGVSIGNKAIIQAAIMKIEELAAQIPAPAPE